MIALVCFLVFSVFAVRSLILIFSERKSIAVKLLDFFFAIFFAAAAGLVLVFTGLKFSSTDLTIFTLIFAAISIATLLPLMFRVRRPYRRRPALLLLKMVAVLILFSIALFTVMSTGFFNLTEDQPILKVTMTGHYTEQPVEWKPPQGELRNERLKAYEVVLQTPDSRPVSRIHIYGDQVAIKAKLLRFRPVLNAVGIHNLYKIEYVHNGYTTAARFNNMPHHAEEIRLAHPYVDAVQDPFWSYWERFYTGQSKSPLVKSATVESNYFPLVYADGSPFHGSYYLTVTPGGMSSVPLP